MDIADPDGVLGGQGFDLAAIVLFLVGDDQIGLEGGYLVRIDIFRSAYAGFLAEPGSGVNAEFGDSDDVGVEVIE